VQLRKGEGQGVPPHLRSKMSTFKERFWAKVDVSGDCWEWTACKTSKGYGQIKFKGETRRAHRISWILHKGEIPKGKKVLHTCDTPSCVRINHLFLGTNAENTADMMKKGRNVAGQALKTHCPKGHEYSGSNLYVRPATGWRACRACHRDGERNRRQK